MLFISLFLPWYRVSIGVIGEDFDALAHGYMYMPLVLSLVELGYLVLIAGLPEIRDRIPVPRDVLLTGINVFNLVVVVVAFFDKFGTGWRFGAIVGLIAAVVAAAPELVIAASANARSR